MAKKFSKIYYNATVKNYSNSWAPGNAQPLDTRTVITSFYQLLSDVPSGDTKSGILLKSIYEGLVFYNTATEKLYVCTAAPDSLTDSNKNTLLTAAKNWAKEKFSLADTSTATLEAKFAESAELYASAEAALSTEIGFLNILKSGSATNSTFGGVDAGYYNFMEVGSGSGVGRGSAAVVGGQGITVTNTQGEATVVDADVDTTKGLNYGIAKQVDYLLGADGSVITPDESVYYYTEKDGVETYYQYTAKTAENTNSTLTVVNKPISESVTIKQIYYEESPVVKSYSQSKLYVPIDTNYLAYTTASVDDGNTVTPSGAITLSQSLIDKIGTVYTAKGSSSIKDLASKVIGTATVGDVYNITEDFWMGEDGSIYVKEEVEGGTATKYTKYTIKTSINDGKVVISMDSANITALPENTILKKYPTGTNLVWRQDQTKSTDGGVINSYSWDALGETWDVDALISGSIGSVSAGTSSAVSISKETTNGSVTLKPNVTIGTDLFTTGSVSVGSASNTAVSFSTGSNQLKVDVNIDTAGLFNQKNYIDIISDESGSTISVTTVDHSRADNKAPLIWEPEGNALAGYVGVSTSSENIISVDENGNLIATASSAQPTWKILCV